MISISDLFTSLSVDQVKASLLSAWADVDLRVTSWAALGKARTILAVVAQSLSNYTTVQAEAIKAGFRETATGKWLTYLAKSGYDVDRILASAGEDTLTLTNANAFPLGDYDAGELRFANAVTGKTYRNKDYIAVDAIAASDSTDITIVADETGTASNAAPGEITEIVSPALLGVTCTNAGSLIGVDEETDAALRVRMAAKLGALSPNGPAEAYTYVALTPELNGGVSVTRVKVIRDNASGEITVIIAGADGTIDGDYTTPDTDVYLVHQGLQTYATPLCVTEITEGAAEITQAVTANVWIYTDKAIATATVQADIAAALTDYFATLPIGGDVKVNGGQGYLFVNALEGIIRAASPVHQVELVTPAANVAISENEIANLGAVTINVTQVVR